MTFQSIPIVMPAIAPTPSGRALTPAAASQPETKVVALPREQFERAIEEVRKVVAPVAQDLKFSLDQQTGKTVVTVVDSATNEVIRQIPGEEMLAIARALGKLEGLLLNHTA